MITTRKHRLWFKMLHKTWTLTHSPDVKQRKEKLRDFIYRSIFAYSIIKPTVWLSYDNFNNNTLFTSLHDKKTCSMTLTIWDTSVIILSSHLHPAGIKNIRIFICWLHNNLLDLQIRFPDENSNFPRIILWTCSRLPICLLPSLRHHHNALEA